MKLTKLNDAVSMYKEPGYKADHPVMALAVKKDKKENGKYLGIVREIVKREGDVSKPGFVDRSELYIVESHDGLKWKRKELLNIKNINRIVNICNKKGMFFIGLEDPDIFVEDDKVHVYFTIAYKLLRKKGCITYLGHAQGSSLYDLEATKPVLSPIWNKMNGFKEATISPIKSKSGRINLVEAGYAKDFGGAGISVIAAALSKDLGKPWKFIKIVGDPKKTKHEWNNLHLSPCAILDYDFLSHNDLLVGIVNGRSKTIMVNNEKIFGKFKVGLMLFNPKTGNIPLISEKPLIDDPAARNITFASDFLKISKEKGILYAQIDDYFVRAYEINAKKLREFLPKSL